MKPKQRNWQLFSTRKIVNARQSREKSAAKQRKNWRRRSIPRAMRPSSSERVTGIRAFSGLSHRGWHEMLQPFGSGNGQPMFFARGVEPTVAPQVLKEKHLVLRLGQKNRFQRAIFFDGALSPLPRAPWDIAFRVNADEYEGETRLQIHVEALRASGPLE